MGVLVLADDVALISTCPRELQAMINLAHSYVYSVTWRYKVNPTKSAIVVINEKFTKPPTLDQWNIGGDTIKKEDKYPHLGITKSSLPQDPTSRMITTGYNTYFSLTGTDQVTGGLLPPLCSQLWHTYCVPRMMYGISTYHLTKAMHKKLDKAQLHLFKRILGLPKSAADESVYLLLDIQPLSHHIHVDNLLTLGQIPGLPRNRVEHRIFLFATHMNTQTIQRWKNLLDQYQLPTLHLLDSPIPYTRWKNMVKTATYEAHRDNIQTAIECKSSLVLWMHGGYSES